MTEKKYTVKELAEKYSVGRTIALQWVRSGKFPNAIKKTIPIEYYLVPESDLVNFVPKGSPGRPLSDNPSPATLAKREQRKRDKK